MSLTQNRLVNWHRPGFPSWFPVATALEVRQSDLRHVLTSLALTFGVTLLLLGATKFITFSDVSIVYLLPVLIAAVRWGFLPAIVAALVGVAASAFFFYPPIYSFRVTNPQELVDLLLFLLAALVTSHLAGVARRHEDELKTLYSFSRRLAAASGPPDIYAAIQTHLNAVLKHRVVLFKAELEHAEVSPDESRVPAAVREAIARAMKQGGTFDDATIRDPLTGTNWLIRAVSHKTSSLGMLAIELGRVSDEDARAISHRVESILSDAAATLERLDVARALAEAKMRSEAETLRDALIRSVSHELHSPLASLVGSTHILANAPVVKSDARLAMLVDDIRCEAERLNDDIQNLLDASRITSAGVRPHTQWADVADIVNAALQRHQRRLSSHRLEIDFADDLPLVHTDPMLVEQALAQILDNARKYSPAGSLIRVAVTAQGEEIVLTVADQGSGIGEDELLRIWERFYRSPCHRAHIAGSGLGLWIARAFIVASGGTIDASRAASEGGAMMTIRLPAPPPAPEDEENGSDG